MTLSLLTEDQQDAHVVLANKLFRDAGFSLAAMQWKRTPEQLAALCKFNGAPDGWKPPFVWGFFPNPAMKEFWERELAGADFLTK